MRRLSKKLDFMPKRNTVPDPLYPARYINISHNVTNSVVTSSVVTYDLNITIETPVPNAWFYYELRGLSSGYVEGVSDPVIGGSYTDSNGDINLLYNITRTHNSSVKPWTVDIYRGVATLDLSGKVFVETLTGEQGSPLKSFSATPSSPYAVKSSSSVIVVSDPNYNSNIGRVRVYSATTGGFIRNINNPTSTPGDYFGDSIDLSDSYIVVGARGAVYVYNSSGSTLLRSHTTAPVGSTDLGSMVAVSGSYALGFGAIPGEGKGYYYRYNLGSGGSDKYLESSILYDVLSDGVDWNGTQMIVGNRDYTDSPPLGVNDPAPGRAYIFNSTTSTLQNTIDNPVPSEGFNRTFGTGKANNSLYTAISNRYYGKVYVYTAGGTYLYTIQGPSASYFGGNLALDENYLIVSDSVADPGGTTNAGTVYIYNISNGALLHTINNPSPSTNGFFGHRISIAGNRVTIATGTSTVWIYTIT